MAVGLRKDGMLELPRPPKDDRELDLAIQALWGAKLPDQRVCEGHVSPFEAVAHAYFAREPGFAVWYASRGSGKSEALAILGLTRFLLQDCDVTILGGSAQQSQNVRNHMTKLLAFKRAPRYAIRRDITTLLEAYTGKQITPLTASETSVRGPHPPLQLLDEIDEMEQDIYDASLGQAMEQLNERGELVGEYIVASSTWQRPDGVMTKVIEDARERGKPVFTWCFRELLKTEQNPSGWMSPRFIQQKRNTVSANMWHVEYELNEPSGSSRAFDTEKVNEYFVPYGEPVHQTHKLDEDHWTWERPVATARYAIGVDWAKEVDKTVIAVVRYDVQPHRLVKLVRVNRRSYDYMVGLVNTAMKDYRGIGMHDATGVGNGVNDFLDDAGGRMHRFVMQGRKRSEFLTDYVTAFEHGTYRLPRGISSTGGLDIGSADPLTVFMRQHRATTVADIFAPGKWDAHLPDDVCAMAMAHRAITNLGGAGAPVGVDKLPEADLRPELYSEGSMGPDTLRVGDMVATDIDSREWWEDVIGGN
jgi:hypothetical protein